MKKISILFIVLVLVFVLSACGQQGMTEEVNDTSNTASYSTTQFVDEMYNENTFENADNQSAYNIQSDTTEFSEKRTKREQIILSCNAISGAVIDKINYDENGRIKSCHYNSKCDKCGKPCATFGAGVASSHVLKTFVCGQCGNTQRIEIEFQYEWIEVEY